jgi:multidrug efflux system membrane fusion protein
MSKSLKIAGGAVVGVAAMVWWLGGPDKMSGMAANKAPGLTSEAQRIVGQLKSDASGSLRPATQVAPSPTQQGSAPSVSVSKPAIRPVVEWDEYTGRFDATDSVEIRTRVSSFLSEIHFKDGQHVDKGDKLYTLDSRPFDRALDQARGELTQAITKVESTTLDVERGKPLVDRKVMSEKTFDDRANALREAQAAVKTAEAKVKTAELDVASCIIYAPFSGRISRTSVPVGSWISAGAISNTTLLTTIVTEDPIHLYFDVNENNWIKYRRLVEQGRNAGVARLGAKVELALPDEKGFPASGVIDFVDNRLDLATGTMRARALVDNKAGLYSAGMFARVRVQGADPYDAILLPDDAIGTDQTTRFVLAVAEDGTVVRKSVVLGPLAYGLRVIKQGVAADDLVIVKGQQRARPGAKVAAKEESIKVAAEAGSTSLRSGASTTTK